MTLRNTYSLNVCLKKLCNESLRVVQQLDQYKPQPYFATDFSQPTNCNLEVVGVRENGRARVRHARGVSPRVSPSRAPVFSCAHCFQTPATRANCNNISLSDKQIKDLRLLLFYVKQNLYTCKRMQKKATTSEFISKLIIQLKIDSQLNVTAFPSSKIKMLFRRLKRIFSIQ